MEYLLLEGLELEVLCSLELEAISGSATATIGAMDDDILVSPDVDRAIDETFIRLNPWSDHSSISGRLSTSSLASLRTEIIFSTTVLLSDIVIPMYSEKIAKSRKYCIICKRVSKYEMNRDDMAE